MTVDLEALLTVQEILPLLPGYSSAKSVLHAVARGTFPIRHQKCGRHVVFTASDVRAYLQDGRATNPLMSTRGAIFGRVTRAKAKSA